jgi:acyl carrier protein
MTTKDQVREILAQQMGVSAASITDNTNAEEIGADSLDQVEILMAIEDELRIEIPDEDTGGITTFGALALIVEAKVMAKNRKANQ